MASINPPNSFRINFHKNENYRISNKMFVCCELCTCNLRRPEINVKKVHEIFFHKEMLVEFCHTSSGASWIKCTTEEEKNETHDANWSEYKDEMYRMVHHMHARCGAHSTQFCVHIKQWRRKKWKILWTMKEKSGTMFFVFLYSFERVYGQPLKNECVGCLLPLAVAHTGLCMPLGELRFDFVNGAETVWFSSQELFRHREQRQWRIPHPVNTHSIVRTLTNGIDDNTNGKWFIVFDWNLRKWVHAQIAR